MQNRLYQAVSSLGCYFVYASLKNYIIKYRDKGESDLWGALVGGFSDMTVNVVKTGAGKVLEMIDDAADVDGFIKYERRFYFSTTITLGSKKFKIMLDILKMLETFGTIMCPLGVYLIKLIFGTLPAAPAPISIPKYPPLPEEV